MPEHDANFWKDLYQNTWGAASDKEEQMAAIIYENTGHPVTGYGLGAGSTEYIEGSAEANGHKNQSPTGQSPEVWRKPDPD